MSSRQPVAPDRGTMQYIEERLKKFQMAVGPMKRGPKRWPRKGGGGGTGAAQLAIVTEEAATATYSGDESGSFKMCPPASPGKAVLLIYELDAQGERTGCLAMPQPTEGNTLADYELDLLNSYDEVPLQVGKLVEVTGTGSKVPAGPYSDTKPKAWGKYHNHEDYRRAKDSYNEAEIQAEYHAAGSDSIVWSGTQCDA